MILVSVSAGYFGRSALGGAQRVTEIQASSTTETRSLTTTTTVSTTTTASTTKTILTSTVISSFHDAGLWAHSTSIVNPSTALELSLSLNVTSVSAGHTLGIVVREYNTLAEDNNLTFPNSWPLPGVVLGACGSQGLPLGVAVYQGYLTSGNISSAEALQTWPPGAVSCPAFIEPGSAYEFNSVSDWAAVYGFCTPGPCFSGHMTSAAWVSGSWGTQTHHTSFNILAPGVYTVAAEDGWGDSVLLYFAVNG